MSGRAYTNLMLMVTSSCNLSCAYCYEGSVHAEGGVMSMGTALKALHMVAVQGKPFHVQITGGEPLLAGERIPEILECIRRNKWPAAISLQTNGVLLDRRTVLMLKRYGVGIGVSLDGPPRVQEKARGGSGATFRALRVLEEEQVPFRVTTVITAMNVSELGGLVMALHPFLTSCGIGFDMLSQKGAAIDASSMLPDAGELKRGVSDFLEVFHALNRSRRKPLEFREKNQLLRSVRSNKASFFCSACRGESLAVTPEGSLYPCTQAIDDPSFSLGTLDVPLIANARALSALTLFSDRCNGCPLNGKCPGECPTRLYYGGTAGRELACTLYRTIYDHCVQQGEIAV